MSADQPASTRSFGQRIRGSAGVFLVQLVVFFVLLEIIARIFDPLGISYFDETARLLDSMIIEEPIGYRLPPGLDDKFHGVSVRINEHGMRDRPVSPIKQPGEFRILSMGDSVIFSVGVEVEDSIPRQLEDIANATAQPGRTYRTLNMGVPSYNTVQELEQLKQVGINLDADVAFLFIVPNDLEDKMWVYDKRGNFVVDIAQRSLAAGLLFYAGRWIVSNIQGVPASPYSEMSEYSKNAFQQDVVQQAVAQPDVAGEVESSSASRAAQRAAGAAVILSNPGWQAVENSLVEINRLLQAKGIPLMVFYRLDYFRTSYKTRINQLAEEHGFVADWIDVLQDPRWEDEDSASFANSATDGHCNPAGCKIYGTLIYEKLLAAGLIR